MGEGVETDKWALAASERKRREREGDEALTGGARVSAGGSRARGLGRLGRGERGEVRARAGWAGIRPSRGRGGSFFSFSFSFSNSNSFLLLFLFLFLFYSFSLETKNIF
jgi:hypothetical protein